MQENVNNACVMLICVQGQSQLVMHQGQRLARNDPCPCELKGATCVVFSGVCRAWGGALRSTWFWTLRLRLRQCPLKQQTHDSRQGFVAAGLYADR